ncbi:MAG: SemiSWEET transporter [Blastococcus sp.]
MIAALGFLAAAVSISVTWPQVWRSCRHGRTLGLSPTASWLGVALNLCWLTFGLLIGDPAQVLTHSFVGVGNAAVLAALLIAQPHLRSRPMLLRTASGALGLGALAAASVAAVGLLGADTAAVAATLSSVISLVGAAAALPQPVSLLRDRTQDVSGLSRTRWVLGAGSCTLWATYGWLIAQPTVFLSAGFGLCCALVMCMVLQTRATAEPAVTPVGPAITVATRQLPRRLVRPVAARAVLAAA